MTWELVEKFSGGNGKYAPYRDRIVVSVHPTGDIGLMPATHAALGNAASINLLVDARNAQIALRAAPEGAENAYTVGKADKGENAVRRVACKVITQRTAMARPNVIMLWEGVVRDGMVVINYAAKPVDMLPYTAYHQTKPRKSANGHSK